MYTKNELMFPYYAIPHLCNVRGDEWQTLVKRILPLHDTHEEVLAFMLLMIRLNRCLSCETDSYRAMRGCVVCTHQSLRRFKESDDELLHMYQQALSDIRTHLSQVNNPAAVVSVAHPGG